MYRGEDVLQVRELFAKGLSKSAIARKLGIDRKTVSRLLAEGSTRRYQRASQPPASVQARSLQRVHPEARPGGRGYQCSSHSPRDSKPWLRRRLYHPERLHEAIAAAAPGQVHHSLRNGTR